MTWVSELGSGGSSVTIPCRKRQRLFSSPVFARLLPKATPCTRQLNARPGQESALGKRRTLRCYLCRSGTRLHAGSPLNHSDGAPIAYYRGTITVVCQRVRPASDDYRTR